MPDLLCMGEPMLEFNRQEPGPDGRVLYLEGGRLVADRPTGRFFEAPADDPLPPEAVQFLKGELPWTP